MTSAAHGRYLKDENDAIGDHLRNHVHLTNCIHLKNHMHRPSPILAERALMRDLTVIQRSWSLRDPSASPHSWYSASVIDSLPKRVEKDVAVREGRRSVGSESLREGRRLSGRSGSVASVATSKVAAAEVSRGNNGGAATSDRSSMGKGRNTRRIKVEESSWKVQSDVSGGTKEPLQDGHNLVDDFVLGKEQPKDKMISQKGKCRHDFHLKTLSEQLNELPMDGNDVDFSHIHHHGRRRRQKRTSGEPEPRTHGYCSGLNRVKKHKFRGVRRARPATGSRDIGAHNELPVASNSLTQGSTQLTYYMEKGEDGVSKLDVMRAPRNRCGIPWNWSRIHYGGKTILDMAGRSLSCGLSESKLRKGSPIPQGKDVSELPVTSDRSSLSTKAKADALPLLIESSGSQESTENSAWLRGYSREVGIFADHYLKHDVDSIFSYEAMSSDQHKCRGRRHGRHQSLMQKYMPRTFKDLVGQNLVAQALSNAVVKRNICFPYVFYGPHGTGKTSCARIFARALNCQSSEHPKPCGVCNSCIALDLGKSRNVRELGPVGNFDFGCIMDVLDDMNTSQLPSQYRVLIFDDCDNFPPDSWSAISKVIDRAPRRVVFVLVSTSLDHLPHMIISRCQKFFFPKLKDADLIYALQWIATKEGLEIDKDALKLIASQSDGSLRDAEMTLEQLCLLGQRISVPLVQELVGLISDEKLVDLLDLALSADTVSTVKNLREIMEAGVEPLALMSQLAAIITDILAGSYVFNKQRLRRKFFRRPTLSKEEMEKLRQALKTLSEAEKQLRMSNDKLTWLTAALLQLAPDQQYMLPSSSADTSFNHSPVVLNNTGRRDMARKANDDHAGMATNDIRKENLLNGNVDDDISENGKMNNSAGGKKHDGMTPQGTSPFSSDTIIASSEHSWGRGCKEIKDIWLAVLEKIQSYALKQFILQEGKLISVTYGTAPTVQLMFSSYLTKSKAEKFREHILQAFESFLGSPVTLEIRCESRKDVRAGVQVPLILPGSDDGSSQMMTNPQSVTNKRMPKAGNYIGTKRVLKDRAVKAVGTSLAKLLHTNSLEMAKSEIVEIVASRREPECKEHVDNSAQFVERGLEGVWIGEAAYSHPKSTLGSYPERRKIGEQDQSRSLIRNKVSLAHVIQQEEGCTQQSGWSRGKAISIAEKLEQENLRLEPRSRSLLCWKASSVTRGKLSRLKTRTRKPRFLLKLVPCSRCLSNKSPSHM